MALQDNSDKEKDVTPIADNSQETDEERKARRQKEQEEGARAEALRQKERADKLETLLVEEAKAKATENNAYLLELHRKDPDLADKVARQFQTADGRDIGSFDEYKRIVESGNRSNDIQQIPEDAQRAQFEKWYAEKEQERLYQQSGNVVEQHFSKLNEEQRELAKAKFQKFVGDRKVTPDEASEIAETITLAMKKDKKSSADAFVASYGSNNLNSSYAPPKTNAVDGADEIAAAVGLGHLYSN